MPHSRPCPRDRPDGHDGDVRRAVFRMGEQHRKIRRHGTDGIGQDLVVRRRLREQHVVDHSRRAAFSHGVENARLQVARPRPAPEFGNAFVVHFHDRDVGHHGP